MTSPNPAEHVASTPPESPERRVARVDGLDLAYADGGDGPAVVYLHGAMTTLDEGLIGLYPTLSPRYRMIAFDRPGHGASERTPLTGSPWRQAAMIHQALGDMGVERPVVIGHSFGGAVAMAYALQFPTDVAGIVALAPIAFPEPRLEHFLFGWRAAPVMGDWLSAMVTPIDELLLPALWGGMFAPQTMTPAFAAGFPFDVGSSRREMKADAEEAVAMITDLTRSAMSYWSCRAPVRVLQGERDAVVNPIHGRGLALQVPGARFTGLPGLGHMAHHFVPEVVAGTVEELLTGEAPA